MFYRNISDIKLRWTLKRMNLTDFNSVIFNNAGASFAFEFFVSVPDIRKKYFLLPLN